ncbi:hypothetical protein HaLaN_16399 [Haematococcus lacustris]|uniref:Uncharacterized protein n=1 Tax=Haematococcus lacustris TaxID=44745 RepID=A0A699ZTY7_HAELA|nr:hypothetical protein HaLaN_16399 [Haematococcus lacustris]
MLTSSQQLERTNDIFQHSKEQLQQTEVSRAGHRRCDVEGAARSKANDPACTAHPGRSQQPAAAGRGGSEEHGAAQVVWDLLNHPAATAAMDQAKLGAHLAVSHSTLLSQSASSQSISSHRSKTRPELDMACPD